MSRQSIPEKLKSDNILVSDGAWGTFLQKKGLKPGECPELWCLEDPSSVLEVAEDYIKAGSDMVETNTFGASAFKLEHFGMTNFAAEINEAAAKISRKAAGEDKWVLGSIGPTGKMLLMGDVTEEELYNAFKTQAVALEKGGADAVCIETMSAIDEAELAVKAAKENTKLTVIATFTFEQTVNGDFKTMMGVSPAQTAQAMVDAGADIVGTNCGNGIKKMIPIVSEIHETVPDTPILVHANAGAPENINGTDQFPDTPEDMKNMVPELVKAGANIIGGCCGTTPAHITAINEAAVNI